MSYTIIKPTTHEQWLEERKKGIGSSDAGTIMGVSPFNTPYGLYLQKIGKAEPFKESDAMFNGHILEPAVAEWFAAKTGNIVDITSEGDWMAVDTDRPYLRVSPDRIYWEKGTPACKQTYENACILEIKSTSKVIDKDELPDYWYCQLQYQMGIMGASHGCLCWITGSPTLHFDYAEVQFNQSFFNSLIERIDKFWNVNILGKVPPEDTTAEDTARRFPTAARGVVAQATEEVFNCYKSLKECRKKMKILEEMESNLIDSLKMAIGSAETLTFTDEDSGKERILATWKNTQKELFDEQSFKHNHPQLWEKFSNTTTETVLDKKSLAKSEKEIYDQYSSRVESYRKIMIK